MSLLRTTHHGRIRLRQRGMRGCDAAFVCEFGTEINGGYLFSRKDAEEVRAYVRNLVALADRLCGTRIICYGADLITAYHATPEQQRVLM